jgi:hypothetical protein
MTLTSHPPQYCKILRQKYSNFCCCCSPLVAVFCYRIMDDRRTEYGDPIDYCTCTAISARMKRASVVSRLVLNERTSTFVPRFMSQAPASSKSRGKFCSSLVVPRLLNADFTLFDVLFYIRGVYQEIYLPRLCFQDSASLLLCPGCRQQSTI